MPNPPTPDEPWTSPTDIVAAIDGVKAAAKQLAAVTDPNPPSAATLTLRRLADELEELEVIAITPVRNVSEQQSKRWIDHPMGAGFTGNRSRVADWLRTEANR